ncbi:MAG: hypothetical protein DKT66_15220 [Candidatus Melainabacteria bacterium]|nr:MAG: hypothetical protein DKT66_15220 [Candidatus Melainabacteria bacterium]
MPLPETHTIEIKVRNAAAYTLNNVVATARSCSPQDLKIAAANVDLVAESGSLPPEVTDFVNYVMTDLFTLLHRSGLYNRQRAFWESIARAVKITVHPVTQGFFKKEALPMYDVHFEDASGGTTLLAFVVLNHAQWNVPKYATAYFKELMHRAQQADKKRPVMKSIVVVAPKPFSEELYKYVDKILGGPNLDPVSRFESVLQSPLTVHLNLFEYGVSAGEPETRDNAQMGTAGQESDEEEISVKSPSYDPAEIDDPNVIGDESLLHPEDMKVRPGRFIFKMIQPDVEKARKR